MLSFPVLAGIGILLGISLAGPPGPVTAILVHRSLNSVLRGMSVGFGAMTADFILMIVVATFGSILNLKSFDRYIYILGAVFFLYLAFRIARTNGSSVQSGKTGSGYVAGLTIGLVNPMQIAWWFTAGLSVLQKFGLITIISLFAGIVIWVIFLAELVNRASLKYEREVVLGVRVFSISALAVFGVLFLLLGITEMFHIML
ncbi:MAG: LysE family translocator [Thermoplasmataceae archaeon]